MFGEIEAVFKAEKMLCPKVHWLKRIKYIFVGFFFKFKK